ncbi:MAG: sulfite exporter TauE/SafE family protein [Pseudomonadota bacterium]
MFIHFFEQYSILLMICYLLIGVFGALITVFIGNGLSLITLPALTFIFMHVFPHAIALKIAIATTMSAITVIGLMITIQYICLGYVPHRSYSLIVLLFGTAGSAIGSHIAMLLPPRWVHIYVGVLLSAIAGYHLVFNKGIIHLNTETKMITMRIFAVVGIMTFIAMIISSASGIASGILLIPILNRYLPYRQAINTSMFATTLPGLIVCTFVYIYHGQQLSIHANLGYIYLPSFISIIIAAMITIIVVKPFVPKFSIVRAKKFFYLCVLITGMIMIFR